MTSSPSGNTRGISAYRVSVVLVAAAFVAAALWYVVGMPGRSYRGPLEFSAEEKQLAARLRAHVEALASGERNVDLERPARYIEQQLGNTTAQAFRSGGRIVRNIETGAGAIVVGAHYDSVPVARAPMTTPRVSRC